MLDSTFSNNTSVTEGGAVAVGTPGQPPSTLTLVNSTLTGNSSDGTTTGGGGVFLLDANATILGTTIAGNNAQLAGASIAEQGAEESLTLGNDLIAGNTVNGVASDCDTQSVLTNAGRDLLSVPGTTRCTLTDGTNGDQVGTTGAPINPLLGPLAANGSATPTQALLVGSPAIGARQRRPVPDSPHQQPRPARRPPQRHHPRRLRHRRLRHRRGMRRRVRPAPATPGSPARAGASVQNRRTP